MTFSPEQIAELGKKLDPAHVKPPAPGKYGNYIEGWHAIAEANRIFGHDGWSYDVVSITPTNSGQFEIEKKYNGMTSKEMQVRVGYMATVSVRAGGVVHTDVGHGQGFAKVQSEGDAHDSAVKEAVTDGLKRALRSFGNPFGLALYDKSHANVGVDVDWAQERDDLTRLIQNCKNLDDLVDLWKTENMQRFLNEAPQEFSNSVIKIKDKQKGNIQQLSEAAA